MIYAYNAYNKLEVKINFEFKKGVGIATKSKETSTVRYKILEGENFDEMAHCNNWRIIFWRMPKSSRKSIMSKFQLSPNKNLPTKTFRRDFTA